MSSRLNCGSSELNCGRTELNCGSSELNCGRTVINFGSMGINCGSMGINCVDTKLLYTRSQLRGWRKEFNWKIRGFIEVFRESTAKKSGFIERRCGFIERRCDFTERRCSFIKEKCGLMAGPDTWEWQMVHSRTKKKEPHQLAWFLQCTQRYLADSNCCTRFCRPLPSHSAKVPFL